MPNTRPTTSTVVPWGERVILNRQGLDRLQQIAASTAVEAESWAEGGDLAARDYLELAAFANGVASALAWLAGEEPMMELAALLELEEAAS